MQWLTTGVRGVQPVAKVFEVLVLRAAAIRDIFSTGYDLVGAAKCVAYNNAVSLSI